MRKSEIPSTKWSNGNLSENNFIIKIYFLFDKNVNAVAVEHGTRSDAAVHRERRRTKNIKELIRDRAAIGSCIETVTKQL